MGNELDAAVVHFQLFVYKQLLQANSIFIGEPLWMTILHQLRFDSQNSCFTQAESKVLIRINTGFLSQARILTAVKFYTSRVSSGAATAELNLSASCGGKCLNRVYRHPSQLSVPEVPTTYLLSYNLIGL